MTRTYQDYFDTLGFRESSSIPGGVQNYRIENRFGFIGKYQFGEAALFDLGYYAVDGSDRGLFRNDWVGNWSGKNDIYSKEDYLNNGPVQEIIVREWHELLWQRIDRQELDKYDGQILNSVQITISGMLAASHLLGTGGLSRYLESGAVFSPQDGNGTTANQYMIFFEGYETPFSFDHSKDRIIEGGAGRDVLTGFGGNDTLIGKENIDTAVFSGHSAEYAIHSHPDGTWTVAHKNNGPDGTDTLISIERIRFSDISIALDLDGYASIIAKTLGAVFGQEAVSSNKTYAGIGLNLLDDGMPYEALMQLAIDTALGAEATDHTAVVDLLYGNVVGTAPSAADQAYYVGLLDSGEHTVASIGVMAANTALNEANIDLVGLSQTGLEYLLIAA